MDAGRLAVITGPTAAGKSALALAIAERAGATIVSADSRQLYRGFDVGTAKPSAAERARVHHTGIDVANPDERWSAARWAEAAAGWIGAAHAEGRPVIIVGGTGLYLRALASPLAQAPALDPARRAALDVVLERLPTAELRRWTVAIDPARAHLGRTQLKRAVETAMLAGQRLSSVFDAAATASAPSAQGVLARRSVRYLVVDPGPVLAGRIEQRVDAMLLGGWLDEVRALMESVHSSASAWNACGYEVLRSHLAGSLGLAEARARVIVATRQYAKRQRTWMRHQLPPETVTRLDPGAVDALERGWAWFRAGEGG